MTPIKKWKKWMAVGCSHGAEIDPEARAAVLRFRSAWKPQTTIHLGDFIDLSAFRAGAIRDTNEADHAADVAGDLMAGIEFLHELEPNQILCGNHEARLWKFSKSPNALLAYAANLTIQKIAETATKLRAPLTPYGIRNFVELGGTKFTWCGQAPTNPEIPFEAEVQVRAHAEPVRCVAQLRNNELMVETHEPILGVAPGQTAVIYVGTRVLGQFTIDRTVSAVPVEVNE